MKNKHITGDVMADIRKWAPKGSKARKDMDAHIRRRRLEGALREQIWPYVVKRPNGGCQILFPLTALDRIVEKAIKNAEKK